MDSNLEFRASACEQTAEYYRLVNKVLTEAYEGGKLTEEQYTQLCHNVRFR